MAWLERYNRARRHSHCGYQAPITFETRNAADQAQAAAVELEHAA